jgi:hypothetical protein
MLKMAAHNALAKFRKDPQVKSAALIVCLLLFLTPRVFHYFLRRLFDKLNHQHCPPLSQGTRLLLGVDNHAK